MINNCLNCEYKEINNGELICNRPFDPEGRLAKVGDSEKECPCHSNRDRMKREGMYIDDGLFRINPKRLKELEDYIFGADNN